MTAPAEPRPHDSYQHEALFYRGLREFLAGTVPFARDGVLAGQAVMVALPGRKVDLVRASLGELAQDVTFADMEVIGRNPAAIIATWRGFVDEAARGDRVARGIGEPIWHGRTPDEITECQLHEALLNLAFDASTPLWLRCPYDRDTLPAGVLVDAERSHAILVESGEVRGSTLYGGADHAASLLAADLPAAVEGAQVLAFGAESLRDVRALVRQAAADAGLCADCAADVSLAVHELALNSVQHGGGHGRVQVWPAPDGLVCDVRDDGQLTDPLLGRRQPRPEDRRGRGSWLALQLCELMQSRGHAEGTLVRVTARCDCAAGPDR